jgi:hypothetical protein
MDSMHEGGDAALDHGFSMVLALAEALRAEFGVEIDAHPGGVGNDAGTVNRAFRAASAVVLQGAGSSEDDLAALLTWVLRQTALRRLDELGVAEPRAEELLDLEPALGDHWLAYLVLAPATVVDDLLRR